MDSRRHSTSARVAAFAAHNGTAVARWVDDINAFGAPEGLYSLHLDLESRARQIGLELNGAKSALMEVRRLKSEQHVEGVTELLFMNLRRGDYGEPDEWVEDDLRLAELQEEVLAEPGHRSTSLLKGLLNSLRANRQFSEATQWLQQAKHTPHAAAALGRYLRAAITDGAVNADATQEQLLDFLSSPWAKLGSAVGAHHRPQ